MSSGWKFTEKLIGCSLIICLGFLLYVEISGIRALIQLFEKYNDRYQISILKLLRNFHAGLLISLIGIFSGAMLIIERKIGWFGSLLTLICLEGLLLSGYFLTPPSNYYDTNENIALFVFFSFIFTGTLVILILKPFREKYQPSLKTWMLLLIISMLALADEFIMKWLQYGT